MDLRSPERRIEDEARHDTREMIRQAREKYLRETTCYSCGTDEDDAVLYPVDDGTMICEMCIPPDQSMSPSGFDHYAKYGGG